MTQQQRSKLTKAINSYLSEFLEGYVLVGFTAGRLNHVITSSANNDCMVAALNKLLSTTTVGGEDNDGPEEEEIHG